jgi:hypothetical protein
MQSEIDSVVERNKFEKMERKLNARGVMSWRNYSSQDWCKLNAIIVELEKNKSATTKLKSENAELRDDRVTKVEQKQLQNNNSSNISSSNFNSFIKMGNHDIFF